MQNKADVIRHLIALGDANKLAISCVDKDDYESLLTLVNAMDNRMIELFLVLGYKNHDIECINNMQQRICELTQQNGWLRSELGLRKENQSIFD